MYASKDYAGEVKTLLSIAKKYNQSEIKKILEIGCGTGNHTIELAKTKKKITAIDTDRFMIDIAKSKTKNLKNISALFTPIEKIKEKDFDVAFAMFNVVTYIADLKSLISFFKGVSSALNKKGVFVFDCWNGIAAMKDPPQSKTSSQNIGDKIITTELNSTTDFINQKVKLDYHFFISDKKSKTIQKDSFSFNQTLWTPLEIKFALESAGLNVIVCCKNFQPEKKATETDWKIMFICSK